MIEAALVVVTAVACLKLVTMLPRCVPFFVGRPVMPGIMWFLGSVSSAVAFALLVLLGMMHLTRMLTCPLCASTGALFLVVDILVGTQRQIFMVHAVQQAIEIPQLLLDEVVDAPGVQVSRVSQAQVVEVFAEIPQLQLVEKALLSQRAGRSCSPRPLGDWALQVRCSSWPGC